MIPAALFLGTLSLLFLILPGWLIARSRNLPLPALAGFIFGLVTLVLVILILEASGVRVSIRTTVPVWLAISLGAVWLGGNPFPSTISINLPPKSEWWFALTLIPALTVVGYRAIMQPLFGADTVFRWNFLAEEMFKRGTLAFYPPVTAMDYSIYSWPDGIAPTVSSLYFWVYSLTNVVRPVLTAPLIIFQFLLVLAAVYGIARQIASPRAAVIACSLVACSPIVLWSTAMGQESGLLTIALLALLLYFPTSTATATANTLTTVAAGLAAALGGLAREYGLVFILFGLILGIIRRLPIRTIHLFLIVALLGSVPWYVRNWLRTGNPFFNLDVAGFFPVNTAHLALMKVYAGSYGWGQLPPAAIRISLTNCAAAIIGSISGACFCFFRSKVLLAALFLMVGLWGVSLGYTAAGFTYSLRVLSPALAIAAILGGVAISRLVPGRTYSAGLLISLSVFACDSALRTLALPANIYRVPVAAWLEVGGAIQQYHQRPIYHRLANFTKGQRILVLGPAALLNQNGAQTLPLWSPEVAFLWNKSLSQDSSVRQLHNQNIGYVLLVTGEVNQRYLSQIHFFNQSPLPLRLIWNEEDMNLYQIAPSRPVSEISP